MDAEEAFDELLTRPSRFLKHHPVNPAGWGGVHAAGAANVRQFRLYKRDAEMPGQAPSGKPAHFGATRPGPFGRREVSSFLVTTVPAAGNVQQRTFDALSVPLRNYNEVDAGALDHYVVDGQGDGVMVTGQLSGCTFAWLPVGAHLLCTHVRPVGIDALGLHNRLNTNGRFAAHPREPLRTFGRNDYSQYANVVGVRKRGRWRLYAQESADQFRTITAAWRLHPGAATYL